MVDLASAFRHLEQKKILVLGDFMCDLYTKGKANRVSPEAPVVVLHVEEQHRLAGGAGNVVFNFKSLGADVYPMGLLGNDDEGYHLKELFQNQNIPTTGLMQSSKVKTIVKNRMIADFQQLLRVDFEIKYHIDHELEEFLISSILEILPNFDVVAISDYQKGFLTNQLLKEVITEARKLKIPVVIDPKGNDFSKYKGASIIKPNSKEAYHAAGVSDSESIEKVASKLLSLGYSDSYIITRSEHGMAYFDHKVTQFFPVKVREVVDVTGAGDTALAMIAFCLANKVDISNMIPLANIASSIAIEKLGCAHVSLTDVAERLIEFSCQNKFLPISQLEAFKPIIRRSPYALYLLEEIESLNFDMLNSLKNSLSIHPNLKKIIYLKKAENASLVLQILASYPEINYILVDRAFVESILEITLPDHIEVISSDSTRVVCEKEMLSSVL